MKTKEEIINLIKSDKEVMKNITKLNYFEIDNFISQAQTYICAIKEGRMICSIGSVSSSGMSRTIKFVSCEKNDNPHYVNSYQYYNYYCLFRALGFRESKKEHYFTISGCGMDMIFHTNYTIIHKLKNLGFLTSDECQVFCQRTPTVI